MIEVYTSITGNKDPDRIDVKNINYFEEFKRPVMNAKFPKICPHKFLDLSEGDITVWVDGNIFLLEEKESFVNWFLGDKDIAVWKHFDRDCIYDEAEAAKGLGGDAIPYINRQIEHYWENRIKRHLGLAECNVIARRNISPVRVFCEAWWAEICRWSNRDQISFPVVLGQFPDLKIKFNDGNVRDHKSFKYIPHK